MKKRLSNKKGMTMVNVLVAFALLLMILLMFSQAVRLAMNLYVSSEDARRHSERIYSQFYAETAYSAQPGDYTLSGSPLRFTQEDGAPAFALEGTGIGSHGSGVDTIWFFGNRKDVDAP